MITKRYAWKPKRNQRKTKILARSAQNGQCKTAVKVDTVETTIHQGKAWHMGKYMATVVKRTTSEMHAEAQWNQANWRCRKVDPSMRSIILVVIMVVIPDNSEDESDRQVDMVYMIPQVLIAQGLV